MPEIREGLVEVIGASIHYQVSGHGPTLLLLSPGDGDADVFSGIAPLLDGFTVVTCDRRGQPRSAIDDPAEPVTISTHADDMARVLVAVTTHAARVFGAGLGAVIGLELVARHPHRVSTLVAFEPSLPTLLDVDAVPAADHVDAHVTGDYVIDSVALRASHVPILPAAGRFSRGAWTHRAAEVLARRLGWPLIEFQGDGAAFVTRPASFAAQLAETLHGVPPPDGTG
jgi:alpha-beta hydrolase superfamily lysophospholipase